MLYHTAGPDGVQIADPKERLGSAVGILKFMAEHAVASAPWYREVFGTFDKLFQQKAESYLFHDYLEDENRPFYFQQFVDLLAARDLAYLAEPEGDSFASLQIAPEARAALEQLTDDPIRREQYADFVRCRNFRRSLVVRAEAPIDRDAPAARLAGLYAVSVLRPVASDPPAPPTDGTAPPANLAGPEVRQFAMPDEQGNVGTDDARVATMLDRLAASWPQATPVQALLDEAGGDPAPLRKALYRLFYQGMLTFYSEPPTLCAAISDRPVADPLARLWIAEGRRHVTSRLHISMELPDVARWLIVRLDGTRDLPSLLEELVAGAVRGAPALERDGQPVTDPDVARVLLEPALDGGLERLQYWGLLVG